MHLPIGQAQEEKWYEQSLANKDRNTQSWAIDVQPADMAVGPWVHIGGCGLHEIDWRHRWAELGIIIGARDYWGRGYGTDAVQTLSGWAFDTLNLNRVFLRVFADNAARHSLLRKSGLPARGAAAPARLQQRRLSRCAAHGFAARRVGSAQPGLGLRRVRFNFPKGRIRPYEISGPDR